MHIIYSNDQPLNCANFNNMCHPLAFLFRFNEPFYINFIALTCLIIFFKSLAFILLYYLVKTKV
jgi:hypothetical protein